MKVVVNHIAVHAGRPFVDGYFVSEDGAPGTHFHGQLEEPLRSECLALMAKVQAESEERLKLRDRMVAQQNQDGLRFTAEEKQDFWKNEISRR